MTKAAKQIPALSEKDKERFLSKISTTPTEKGCLEWMAYTDKHGYGTFSVKARPFRAHRITYFLETGIDPLGLCVCHSCDNPSCVNFVHLWLGTDADNIHDKENKGRGNKVRGDDHYSRLRPEVMPRGDKHHTRLRPEAVARGEKHGKAKLTTADILSIRDDTRKQRTIASEYGVSPAHICNIKRSKKWAHIV